MGEDVMDSCADGSDRFSWLLFLEVACNIAADVSEDVTSLEKLGVVRKGVLPKRTEYYANWCQLVLAVVEIVVSHVKARRAKEKSEAAGGLDVEKRRKSQMA